MAIINVEFGKPIRCQFERRTTMTRFVILALFLSFCLAKFCNFYFFMLIKQKVPTE